MFLSNPVLVFINWRNVVIYQNGLLKAFYCYLSCYLVELRKTVRDEIFIEVLRFDIA